MRNTTFKLGDQTVTQELYFPDDHSMMPGWFKGMEIIIQEWGLWPEKGLNAQCEDSNVLPRRPTAVATASFSCNLISLHRNHTLKN